LNLVESWLVDLIKKAKSMPAQTLKHYFGVEE
jgi:hypothetical protein